jgi:DNA-3-methyladenine glycosylase
MFGRPGRAYVYAIHSRYCMNAVTEAQGVGSAVLIRAVEPLLGLLLMEERRRGCAARDLTRGPARLCEAFAIDRDCDGLLLEPASGLWIEVGEPVPDEHVAVTPRIGVTSAQELPLRFIDITSVNLSRPYRVR